MTRRLLTDATWCWWTKPRAIQLGETLYLAAIDSQGNVFAATLDAQTGDARRSVLATHEPDDHNNPALVVVPGRTALAFYSRHDADNFVRYRESTAHADVLDWGPEKVIEFPGVTSYAQVHAVGNYLTLFTRCGVTSWHFSRSADWGNSWTEPQPFISLDTDQLVYMPTTMLADGRTVRVAITGHPKEYDLKPIHNIWTCVFDLQTGEVSRPSTGDVVANLFHGSGLPLHETDLELAFECPPDRTINLFDVGDGPDFEIGFASKNIGDRATTDGRYEVCAMHNGRWASETVSPSGGIFGYIHAGMYVGGVSFPDQTTGGRIYVSREEGGLWHVEEWSRRPDGSWLGVPLEQPGSTRIVRPWAMAGHGVGPSLLALELERYDNNYMNVVSHVVEVGGRG